MKKSILLIFLLYANLSLFGQNFEKLDSFIEKLAQHNRFMGTVAMSQNGEIVYHKAVGNSNFKRHQIPNRKSQYKIGSISKTYTAAMIIQAVEAGKISLDMTIDRYFPNIKNAEKITIEQLLRHRSGIHNFTSLEHYLDFNTMPKSESEMLDIIQKAGSDFTPDSSFSYSNSNYHLLGIILEKTYGKPYADILQEQIVEPLDLENTRIADAIDTDQECHSYEYYGKWIRSEETHASILKGAGDVIATADGLVAFLEALANGKVVSNTSLEQMKDFKGSYGFGLFEVPFKDKKGFGHTGGVDGFSSAAYHFPDGNISIALLSNGSDYDNNDIVVKALQTMYEIDFEMPKLKEKIYINSDILDQYKGTYIADDFPLDLIITRKGNVLVAQATGQPSFPLDALGEDTFEKESIKLKLVFDPQKGSVIVTQYGMPFTLKKK